MGSFFARPRPDQEDQSAVRQEGATDHADLFRERSEQVTQPTSQQPRDLMRGVENEEKKGAVQLEGARQNTWQLYQDEEKSSHSIAQPVQQEEKKEGKRDEADQAPEKSLTEQLLAYIAQSPLSEETKQILAAFVEGMLEDHSPEPSLSSEVRVSISLVHLHRLKQEIANKYWAWLSKSAPGLRQNSEDFFKNLENCYLVKTIDQSDFNAYSRFFDALYPPTYLPILPYSGSAHNFSASAARLNRYWASLETFASLCRDLIDVFVFIEGVSKTQGDTKGPLSQNQEDQLRHLLTQRKVQMVSMAPPIASTLNACAEAIKLYRARGGTIDTLAPLIESWLNQGRSPAEHVYVPRHGGFSEAHIEFAQALAEHNEDSLRQLQYWIEENMPQGPIDRHTFEAMEQD